MQVNNSKMLTIEEKYVESVVTYNAVMKFLLQVFM